MTEADDNTLQRIYRAVEKTLQARQARAAIRRDLDAARQAGLIARHRQKLARNPQEETMPATPPCCVGAADGACPQHRQHQRAVQPKPRIRTDVGRVIGEPGNAKPAPEPGDQP